MISIFYYDLPSKIYLWQYVVYLSSQVNQIEKHLQLDFFQMQIQFGPSPAVVSTFPCPPDILKYVFIVENISVVWNEWS